MIALSDDAVRGNWMPFREGGYAALRDPDIGVALAWHEGYRAGAASSPGRLPVRPDRCTDTGYWAYCEGFAQAAVPLGILDDLVILLRECRARGWLDEAP